MNKNATKKLVEVLLCDSNYPTFKENLLKLTEIEDQQELNKQYQVISKSLKVIHFILLFATLIIFCILQLVIFALIQNLFFVGAVSIINLILCLSVILHYNKIIKTLHTLTDLVVKLII
jgi:Flp pilus assembly protein TadB